LDISAGEIRLRIHKESREMEVQQGKVDAPLAR